MYMYIPVSHPIGLSSMAPVPREAEPTPKPSFSSEPEPQLPTLLSVAAAVATTWD